MRPWPTTTRSNSEPSAWRVTRPSCRCWQDPLTFAGNRRMMRRNLTAAVSASSRSGKRFTLILPDHGPASPGAVAESLHGRISEQLSWSGEPVRFSTGVAAPGGDEDWLAPIPRADRAMYQTNHAGRDRILVVSDRHRPGADAIAPKTERLRDADA